jgi:ketosteroid isomerase-like protein
VSPEQTVQPRQPGCERPLLSDSPQVRELVTGWTLAFNRRDLDGLTALADPEIAYHPTILAHGQRVYRGHDGLRTWLTDLAHANAHHTVTVRRLRESVSGDVLVFGQIIDDDDPISPYAMLIRLSGRRILEAHAYLSDESMMQSLGLLAR